MTRNYILTVLVLMMFNHCAFSQEIVESNDSTTRGDDKTLEELDGIIAGFEKYRLQYKVECVQEKITNNQGEGYDDLYGTRNFRVVLHGVAYRGGGGYLQERHTALLYQQRIRHVPSLLAIDRGNLRY